MHAKRQCLALRAPRLVARVDAMRHPPFPVGSSEAVCDVTTWWDALVAELDGLGSWLVGRVVVPGPTDEVVPSVLYLRRDYLRDAIRRVATTPIHSAPGSEPDRAVRLGVAASRFTRHYANALNATALIGLVRGVGLDLSAERCQRVVWANLPYRLAVDQDDRAVVGCVERPTTWPVPHASVQSVEELRTHVRRKLYGEHLAPLFAKVAEVTRVSAKVLWSNAAESVGGLYETAYRRLGPSAGQAFVEDGESLLRAATLPDVAGPNPLRDTLTWIPVDEPDFPLGVQTRHHCCMTYLLAERAGYLCFNCPFLPLPDRVALAREQRDRPPSRGMDGPAAQRSIEHGRKKLRSMP